MKIELGKTYVNRKGQAIKIVQDFEGHVEPTLKLRFLGDAGWYYSEDGKVDPNCPNDQAQDLVSEVITEETIKDLEGKWEAYRVPVLEEDMVNSPSHYTQGGVECIDAIQSSLSPEEFRGYLRGNILKYMWRTNHKGGKQDLEKSLWYLNKLIGTFE